MIVSRLTALLTSGILGAVALVGGFFAGSLWVVGL